MQCIWSNLSFKWYVSVFIKAIFFYQIFNFLTSIKTIRVYKVNKPNLYEIISKRKFIYVEKEVQLTF